MDWVRVVRGAVSPVLAAYLVVLGALVAHRRSRSLRSGPRPTRDAGLVATATRGYAAFALIVALFYLVLGDRPPDFLVGALLEGLALTLLVLLAFALLDAAERRVRAWLARRAVAP